MANKPSGSDSHVPPEDPSKTTLFSIEQTGITYRIPALIYLHVEQTFLAFAEKRTSANDHDATFLVMRRGKRQNGSIQWSAVQEISTASLPGFRTMNPCPVYERNSKTLFLFFICVLGKISEYNQIHTGRNKARLCYITSEDGGLNWSSVVDLTISVIGHEIRNWATFAVGPGHGIQMASGRLIIPAYVYYIHHRCFPFRFPLVVKPHAFAFYSDDLGSTWYFGDRVNMESCECEMAEIMKHESRSELYCNARSAKGHRVEASSVSSGKAFERSGFVQKLVEPSHGCQGSLVSFTAQKDQENFSKTWLLYCHPTDRMIRKDLGVYLNDCPPSISGWSKPWIIHHGPSGYSDLSVCEQSDRFACLMECGEKSELEEIAFVEFSLSDLRKKL